MLRWLAGLHSLAITAQLVSALLLVGGIGNAFLVHSALTRPVLALGVGQLFAFSVPTMRTIGPTYLAFAVLVTGCELVQDFVIPRGSWALHVSNAIVIWGASLAIFVRLLDPAWTTPAATEAA